MLMKWIVCNVAADRHAAFSLAQERWRALATLDGFSGQVGGWSTRDPDCACIAGFWRDQIALDRFMEDQHDRIVQHSKQTETYTAIRVSIFDIEDVTPALGAMTGLCTAGRMIEFVRHEEMMLRVALRSGSLDADTVRIEPAWTVEPKG